MADTRTMNLKKHATILLGSLWLCASGCGGGGEDSISGFAGQTNSKDKQEIASTVKPPAERPAGASPTNVPSPAGPTVASKTPQVQSETPGVIREKTSAYRAGGRKDPFRSLMGGDVARADLVDLSVVTLVGICRNGGRPFCVVEDAEGNSFILRKGDRVKNGRVVGIRDGALIASQTILGYTTTVQLSLDSGKDGIHG